MQGSDWAQIVVVVLLLAISVPLLGSYMAKVYGDGPAPGDRLFAPPSGSSIASAASTPTASSAGPCTRSRCSRSASSAS